MIKIITRIFIIFLLVFISATIFLATFGYETNRFNNRISKKVNELEYGTTINFKTIKIKLDIKNLKVFFSTNNPQVKFKDTFVPVKEIRVYYPITSILKSKSDVEVVNIDTEYIDIIDIKKIALNFKPSNYKKFLINNLKKGKVKLKVDLILNEKMQVQEISSSGLVIDLNSEFFNKIKLNKASFIFSINKKEGALTNIKGNLNGIPLNSGSLTYINDNGLDLTGNIDSMMEVDNKKLKSLLLTNKYSNILNNEIFIKSNLKHKIGVKFNKTLKVENFNYSVKGDIKKSLIKFNKPYKIGVLEDKISQLEIKNSEFSFNYDLKKNNFISLNGLYDLGTNKFKKINFKNYINKNNSNITFDIAFDNRFYIPLINYKKDNNNIGIIKGNLILSDKEINFKNFSYDESNNKISVKNLITDNDGNFKSLSSAYIKTSKKGKINNDFEILYGKDIKIKGKSYDGRNLIRIINNAGNNLNLKNINKKIEIKFNNIFSNLSKNINNFVLLGEIKKGEFIKISSKGNYDQDNHIDILLKKNPKNKTKYIEIYTDYPETLLDNFDFFKGINGGKLLYSSVFDDKKSYSNLSLENFKIKNAPAFVKLLSLADLGGMVDLMSGEGLTFDKMELKFNKSKSVLNLEELYAIGPSISILMEGYQDPSSNLISLRGTMVPAKNLNKILSKIPIVGKIIIPKDVGEGLFGVSFKIKGTPGNLKTSVNPVKTLTPRFITKALEKKKIK